MNKKANFRLVLSFVIALMATAGVFPQEIEKKYTVAVLPFVESGRARYGAYEIANCLFDDLDKSGKLQMVEKQKAESLEAEILKSIREKADASNTRPVGEKIGAEILILGNLAEYTEKQKSSPTGMAPYEHIIRFNLRIVRASSGEVIFERTFDKSGYSVGASRGSVNDVARKSIKEAAALVVKAILQSSKSN